MRGCVGFSVASCGEAENVLAESARLALLHGLLESQQTE